MNLDAPHRIALIAPFGLSAKGTTRARVLPLGKALARQGRQVAVFVPAYDSPSDVGRSRVEDGIDIITLGLPAGSGTNPGPGHVGLGVSVARAVEAWAPDVVHAFKPKGPSGLAGMILWARRAPSGLVVDADDWEGPGGWNDDPRTGYSIAARRVFAWQERFGLSHADAWTVTSACLSALAVDFGADDARIVHLPNGVSDSTLTRVSREPEPNTVLLYTRFAGVRIADVAAMWTHVRGLILDARLIVVGRGPAGEEDALARLSGVTCAGWVAEDALPTWFARCAVAVLPWADTPTNRARHSAKLLELMGAGLPIVACAVGEIPATLDDAGVLVTPGDTASFASAVAMLLNDPGRAGSLGAAAQARVAARFTWAQLAERAVEAYRIARCRRAQR